uniref:ZP domain-containing protein n=1 Tax=Loxodonta africana TaxID=9785 RepID=G3U670_LOXAF
SEELTATTTSTALNTTGNDVTSSGSMRTRVSKNSATALAPTTPNISKDMKESLSTTTSPESTSATFTTLGTTMSGTQNSVTTTAPTTMNIITFATFGTTMSGTLGNDITASGSMRSTVSKKSATTTAPTTLNISKDMKESLLVTTSVQPTPVTFTTLGTAMSATPGSDITSSGSMRSTVFEKSATITASTTPNINKDLRESLCTTTSVQPSPVTVTTLGTTMSGTPVTFTTFETQEEETTAAPSALTMVFTKDMNSSISLMSTLSETYHNTATQTPSHLAELASSAGTATAQSPETTAAHSTALISRSSGTTKSSPVAEDSHLPKYAQNSGPRAGACASGEYATSGKGCTGNDNYYAHSELSSVTVTLHCRLQEIEVVLSSCFLKTRHWILREDTLSGCPNVSKMEQGRRGQAFLVTKKEDTCGLCLSTNSSHALYSLEVQLLQVSNTNIITDFKTLNFSCAYSLMVNVSQTHPHPVVSFLYSTIHVPGTGDTIVTLGIFTDPQLSSPLENKTAPLGMPLYVVLSATSSDPDRFVLVANEVFASTDNSRTGAAKATHHFVNKSCPVNNRLLQGLRANGASLKVMLAFKLYRFLSSDMFYRHGRVTLCDKRAGRPCQPNCSQISLSGRNRAWQIRAREGLGVGDGWMVFGPIRISESNASSSRSPAGAWVVIFLLMVKSWMLG